MTFLLLFSVLLLWQSTVLQLTILFISPKSFSFNQQKRSKPTNQSFLPQIFDPKLKQMHLIPGDFNYDETSPNCIKGVVVAHTDAFAAYLTRDRVISLSPLWRNRDVPQIKPDPVLHFLLWGEGAGNYRS